MGLLILRRGILQRAAERRGAQRRVLVDQLLSGLERGGEVGGLQTAFGAKAPGLVADVAEEILALLRGKDKTRMLQMFRSLGLVELQLRLLRSRSAEQRAKAVALLAHFPEPEVIENLRRCLADADANVRLTAAEALVEQDVEMDLDLLLEQLQVGEVEHSLRLRHVFRRLAPRMSQAFAAHLRSEVPAAVKVLLLNALARTGEFGLVEQVLPCLEDPSVNVRAEALRCLASFAYPVDAAWLIRAMEDPAWEVRAQAALAAGRIGLPDTLESLKRLLGDPAWWVRYRAAEALHGLGVEGRQALWWLAAADAEGAQIAQAVLAEKAQPT